MSTAQFTVPLIVVIPGQVIAASLWNGEFQNISTNFNPQGMGAYSDTDVQMQTATDPYPGNVTSRPTAVSGEFERLRFAISEIKGTTYWYQDPDDTINNLNTRVDALETLIPTGTVMVFYQAAAPTGWTQVTTQNDKALRVVSSAGGGSGGTNAMSAGLSHSHTVASHTHTISHEHTTPLGSVGPSGGANVNKWVPNTPNDWGASISDISINVVDISRGATIGTQTISFMKTRGMDTANSGSASPTTDSQAPTFQYADVIIASKN